MDYDYNSISTAEKRNLIINYEIFDVLKINLLDYDDLLEQFNKYYNNKDYDGLINFLNYMINELKREENCNESWKKRFELFQKYCLDDRRIESIIKVIHRLINEKDFLNISYNTKIYMKSIFTALADDNQKVAQTSLLQLYPLITMCTPEISEADYILYYHSYARMYEANNIIIKDIDELIEKKKKNAKIILLGSTINIKNELLDNNYNLDDFIFIDEPYVSKLGKIFNLNIHDEFIVYDDQYYGNNINIWPTNGCMKKCDFCRNCYTNIPIYSIPFDKIKEKLDWYQKKNPNALDVVKLRADNLLEYKDNDKDFSDVFKLVESYEEVNTIKITIGAPISEVNDKILNTLADSKKLKVIALNIEAGTNRLLRLTNKGHTIERATFICQKLKEHNPNLLIKGAGIIGLPTETDDDIINLAKIINECQYDTVHCNFYAFNHKHKLLAKYEQLDFQTKSLRLKLFIDTLKNIKTNNTILLRYPYYNSYMSDDVFDIHRIENVNDEERIYTEYTYALISPNKSLITLGITIINKEIYYVYEYNNEIYYLKEKLDLQRLKLDSEFDKFDIKSKILALKKE